MSEARVAGRFWPSHVQARLLAAALGDGGEAVEAWVEVRPELVLDELEPGTFELLPLIYRNLTEAGYEDEELPRLKGIYRRAWVRNNLLVERTAETSEALEDAGVTALYLEGVVLASRFYPELGLRPTSMIDLLVDEQDVRRAAYRLARLGWRDPAASSSARLEARYLLDPGGSVCLLRSRIGPDFAAASAGNPNGPLWSTAQRQALGGREVHVPSPAMTLLAVCLAHARAAEPRNVQWLADAKLILSEPVSWDELLEKTREHRQVVRVREALRYLAWLPGAKPPQTVLDVLFREDVTPRERLVYFLAGRAGGTAGAVPRLVAEHVASTADQSSVRALTTFPRHLKERWGLSHTWRVPLAAGQRALRLLSGDPDRTP